MLKICDALCDANTMECLNRSAPHLWLRNHIFYIRMEAERVNGKRRYKRISLHTSNFYEARAIIMQQNEIQAQLTELRQLYGQLIIQEFQEFKQSTPPNCYGIQIHIPVIRKISTRNNRSLLERVWSCYTNIMSSLNSTKNRLTGKDKDIINVIKNNEDVFYQLGVAIGRGFSEGRAFSLEKQQATSQIQTIQTPTKNEQTFTIYQMMEKMLSCKNNKKIVKQRKRLNIQKLINEAGLNVMDNYQRLHNQATIEQIAEKVKSWPFKGDNKRIYIRNLGELLKFANSIDSEQFPSNVLAVLPNIEKTKKFDKQPHLYYTNDQLLSIFNPDNKIFKKNPDFFWICMIALFTGARQNAAFTLQYDDIIQKDGIDCIWFRSNHEIKRLKNEASERLVPIHSQLKGLGFLDFIKRKKATTKSKGTDFIFSKCISSGGHYNNKYIVHNLAPLLKKIGIKSESHDGYDFHSFRKTLNVSLINAGIKTPYIDKIIGWDAKNMSEGTYFTVNLNDILNEFEKFSYDFLTSHFATWKTIMAKKP